MEKFLGCAVSSRTEVRADTNQTNYVIFHRASTVRITSVRNSLCFVQSSALEGIFKDFAEVTNFSVMVLFNVNRF